MPIYEFQCDACGHQFEKLRKIDEALPDCPVCNKTTVRKLISPVSFQLKGSGWYKSDYKNAENKTEAKKSDGAQSGKEVKKESDKSSGGNESNKPETKNETKTKTETANNSKIKDVA